jgi:hypothetical protein
MNPSRYVALAAAAWLIVGCSASGGASNNPPGAPDGSDDIEPISSPAAPTPGRLDLPSSFIDPVVAEVARVANVPSEAVEVISAGPVTFPNGALGCPAPGVLYTQVQVDGYRIVLAVGGTTYDYRGTAPGTFRRCT